MDTAKIFENGRSQAVRLPMQYRFTGEEVYIQKLGEAVILFPKDKAFETFMEGIDGFTEDYYEIVEKAHGEEIMSERIDL